MWLLFLLSSHLAAAQKVGEFVSYQLVEGAVEITDGSRKLVIEIIENDVLKVQNIANDETPFGRSSGIIAQNRQGITEILESETSISFYIANYSVEIRKFPIRLSLVSELNGEKIFEEIEGISTKSDTASLSFKNNPTDTFQGTGARPYNSNLNRRIINIGNTYNGNYYEDAVGLEQSINTPFVVNSNKYGLLLDSDDPGIIRLDIGGFDSTKVNFRAIGKGKWAYYILVGSNDEILNKYTNLTGKQGIPPRWVFGVLQSKDSYTGENEIISTVSNYERRNMPLDAIFFDKQWTGADSTLGNFQFSSIGFPRPNQMLSDLASKGIASVLRIDPNIHIQSQRFPIVNQLNLLSKQPNGQIGVNQSPYGPLALFDIEKVNTKTYLKDRLDDLENLGVEAFWLSNTEPRFSPKNIEFKKGLFSLEWSKVMEGRSFYFANSGYVGSQRYGIIPRSGDVARFWTGFKLQIPIMIHAGMSGFAYMHSDIGGYATGPGLAAKNEELDVRWLQMSVFTPVVRFHGKRAITEPFGLNEPFLGYAKNALNLRYALQPYIYSMAYLNSTLGRPFCLPMDYFSKNPYLQNRNDQYFFGEQLLVAPVLLYGMPLRRVDLPEGAWFNFWTSERHEGGKPIFQELVLDNIPVYAKAGAILPLAKTNETRLKNYQSDSLQIFYFQDASVENSSFEMYENSGEGSLSQNEEFITFEGITTQNNLSLKIRSSSLSKPVLSSRHIEFVFKNFTSLPQKITLDNQDLEFVISEEDYKNGASAYFDLSKKELKVKFQWNNKDDREVKVQRNGLSVILSNEVETIAEMSISPNPAQNDFIISFAPKASQNFELKIVDLNGRLVYEKSIGYVRSNEKIETSIRLIQPAGIYFVKLKGSENNELTQKLIIN